MKKEEFFNIGLPKWPALIVQGEKITPEQAAEIIIRTGGGFSCNDRRFTNACESLVYEVEIPEEEMDRYDAASDVIKQKLNIGEKDWMKVFDYKEEKQRELGIMADLCYLNNQRVCSSWVGGPYGWCNWDGAIGTSNYNIGKWPSVEEVYNEWKIIAKTFPFLSLRCQLANHEASETEDVGNPRPVIEYIIKGGKVKMVLPKDYIVVPEFGPFRNISDESSEIGCSLDQFLNALSLVREKIKK